MSELLVNTNVLVYGIDQDFKFFTRSRNILDHSDHQFITTSKNLVEFLVVVTRNSGHGLKNGFSIRMLPENSPDEIFVDIKNE